MQFPCGGARGVEHDEGVQGAGGDAVAVAEGEGGLLRHGGAREDGAGEEAVGGSGREGDLDLFAGEEAGSEVCGDGGGGLRLGLGSGEEEEEGEVEEAEGHGGREVVITRLLIVEGTVMIAFDFATKLRLEIST